MKFVYLLAAFLFGAGFAQSQTIYDEGTVYLDTRIMNETDPTAFLHVTYMGVEARQTFDRRSGWTQFRPFLFKVEYRDGTTAEAQVNPEFGSRATAERLAVRFAKEIGRLPSVLRNGMETIWIHAGQHPFGGGNGGFLIHTGLADAYPKALQEALIHEGVHLSLDDPWASSPGWQAAQAKDARFISPYAQEFPEREDLAETFVIWMASRYFPDRMDADALKRAEDGNAARFAFLDGLNLDMSPYVLKR